MVTPDEKQIVENAIRVTRQAKELNELAEDAKKMFAEGRRLADDARRYHDDIQKIVAEKTICFPWLADAIARFHEAADLKLSEFLAAKVNPATGTADKVREIAKKRREALHSFHLARFRVKYYESLFPWLEEYVEGDLDELVRQDIARLTPDAEENDPVEGILSRLPPAEYNKLTTTERNQRALDLWRQSGRKSPWEVGRDYERYLGYLYERDGYEVQYHGATEGLEDMGRDLIVRKNGQTVVIQCKYWAEHKSIREKHVFQLYGTVVQMQLEEAGWLAPETPLLFRESDKLGIQPLLITSTVLSDKARAVAKALGVQFREHQAFDRDYPVIKCNVSQRDGGRIYHLPFDQQYDRTVVHTHRGEFYAKTVAEAEKKGFRRAWRFKGPFA